MKRKLSVLLAAAMVVSMMPVGAFAETRSSVDRRITAAKNQDLVLGVPTSDQQKAPLLRLAVQDDRIGVEGDIFRLSFDNADWKYRTYDSYNENVKGTYSFTANPHAMSEVNQVLYYADYVLGNGRFESYPISLTKIGGKLVSAKVLTEGEANTYDSEIMAQAIKGELDYRQANIVKAANDLLDSYNNSLNSKAMSANAQAAYNSLKSNLEATKDAAITNINTVRSNATSNVGNTAFINGEFLDIAGLPKDATDGEVITGYANSQGVKVGGRDSFVNTYTSIKTQYGLDNSVYGAKAVLSMTAAHDNFVASINALADSFDKIRYDMIMYSNPTIMDVDNDGTTDIEESVNYKGNTINYNFKASHYGVNKFGVAINSSIYSNGTNGYGKYTIGGDVVVPLTTRVEEGVAKVTVESGNTGITATSHEFANGSGGATTVTVDGAKDFNYISNKFMLIIDEARGNSIETGTNRQIRVKAPAGFEWVSDTVNTNSTSVLTPAVLVNGLNGLSDARYTFNATGNTYTASYSKYGYGNGTTGNGNTTVVQNPDGTTTTTIVSGSTAYDRETLVLTTVGDGYNRSSTNSTGVGTIFLKDLRLVATDAAASGDVKVEVSGDGITTQSVSIGSYKDFGVKVTSEAPVTVVSGRGVQDIAKVTLKENVSGSWLGAGRKTTFTFPEGVKVVGATIESSDIENLDGDIKYQFTERGQNALNGQVKDQLYTDSRWFGKNVSGTVGSLASGNANIDFSGNLVTIGNLDVKKDGKAELKITFQVTAKPGVEGDMELKVGGSALTDENADQIVLPAKVVSPVTLTTKVTEINIGYKNLALADLVITENIAGAIQKSASNITGNRSLELGIEGSLTGGGIKNAKWEVTDGDMLLNQLNATSATVKRASTKPSTIKISGITVDVDRTPSEGMYWIGIGGGALVENYKTTNSIIKFDEQYYTVDTVEVVTAAPDKDATYTRAATFTIGSTKMMVNGVEETMDVAPYIADNRTMLPLRAVSVALGIPDTNLIWDDANRTATVSKGDRVAQVKIGSKELLINGVPVTMDTEAVIKEERTFVPIAYLAQALGVTYTWDEATKSAMFNPQNTEAQSSENKKDDSTSKTEELKTTDDTTK